MTSRYFGQFLTPPPPIVTRFATKALVFSSQNPSPPPPPQERDLIYGRPHKVNGAKASQTFAT